MMFISSVFPLGSFHYYLHLEIEKLNLRNIPELG